MITSAVPLLCRPTHPPALVRRVPRLFADWNRADNTPPHLPADSPPPTTDQAPKALPALVTRTSGTAP